MTRSFSARIVLDITATTCGSIAVIAGLVLMDAVNDQLDLTLRGITNVSPLSAVLQSLPYLLTYIVPISTVIGSSLVLGRLYGSNETVMLRGLGMSPLAEWRAVLLVSTASAVVVLLSHWINTFPGVRALAESDTQSLQQLESIQEATPIHTGGWYIYSHSASDGNLAGFIAISPKDDDSLLIVSSASASTEWEASEPVLRLRNPQVLSIAASATETRRPLVMQGGTFTLRADQREVESDHRENPLGFTLWLVAFLLALASLTVSLAPQCRGGRNLLLLCITLPTISLGTGVLRALVGDVTGVSTSDHIAAALVVAVLLVAGLIPLFRQHRRL